MSSRGWGTRPVGLDGPQGADAGPTTPAESILRAPVAEALQGDGFGDTRVEEFDADAVVVSSGLPGLTHWPAARQRRVLRLVLWAALVVLLLTAIVSLMGAASGTQQLLAAGQAQAHVQRTVKSAALALAGRDEAFVDLRDSAARLTESLQRAQIPRAGATADSNTGSPALRPAVERITAFTQQILALQSTLLRAHAVTRALSQQSADLLETAETVLSLKLQAKAGVAELTAASQLVMLTQRIGKSGSELIGVDGVSAEAVLQLGKDLTLFRDVVDALLNGSVALRLPATRDGPTRERLQQLSRQHEDSRELASGVLDPLNQLVAARQAQVGLSADADTVSQGLSDVQQGLAGAAGVSLLRWALMGVALVLGALAALGLLRLFASDQARRAQVAQTQRLQAERAERDAKRAHDTNQAAILRLMNELQWFADGDLTQQATVTEDITGAIADSVNYTVEELRNLVGQVQRTAQRVKATTGEVGSRSQDMHRQALAQLREIRETGEAVLAMTGRIKEVATRAQSTAEAAERTLAVAETGHRAVQATTMGMSQIREHIRETAKRIKRLGESSQEIGDITELVADITEQTNVLALNAAIQAASAGEAGRGFAVVAAEVQRLAERSGDATRQIAALVRTLQADAQDAVGAMESSTAGVVEGTRLSDAASRALADVDQVTRQLNELIAQIAAQTQAQEAAANQVAANIAHIFDVTEHTGEGTRDTVRRVQELSATVEELERSVARFKIE